MVSCDSKSKAKFGKRFQTCCKYVWIIIFGTVTLLFLVLTIQRADPDTLDPNIKDTRMYIPERGIVSWTGCRSYKCSVICINSTELTYDLNQAVYANGCTVIETLHIDKQTFPNNILPTAWARPLVTFYEILITNSDINQIAPGAFDGDAFTQTFSLAMEYVSLTSLDGSTMLGLARLESLSIIAPIDYISRVFFQPIRATLKTLKLSFMDDEIQFDDIFGANNMTNLEDLDLSNNNFFRPITKTGFLRLSKIRYLDLSRSHITAIGPNAFDPIAKTLKFLDLSHNNLTTLTYDTLQGIFVMKKTYLYLRENHWTCDCVLTSLLHFYNIYSDIFLDVPICRAPPEFYGEPINLVEFCPLPATDLATTASEEGDLTISSIESTLKGRGSSDDDFTKSAKTTAANIIYPTIKVPCLSSNLSAGDSFYQYIHLNPPTHFFRLVYLGQRSVEIYVVNYDDTMTILWLHDSDVFGILTRSETSCSEHTNGSLIIPNLIANTTYIFCVLPKDVTTVTPFNCLPIYIPRDQDVPCSECWMSAENEELLMILGCIVLATSFIAGAGFSYLVVRKFPEMLKGSKRVLVVQRSKKEKEKPISTISEATERRPVRRPAPSPPPYNKFSEEESSYEIPIEVVENEYLDEFQRCYLEPLSIVEIRPEVPPPLPKRNSEQLNSTSSAPTREKFTKRSI